MASRVAASTSPPLAMSSSISLAEITVFMELRGNAPGSIRSGVQLLVKDLVHERGIDGVNGRRRVKRLCGLAAFDVTDGLSGSAAERVVNDEAGFCAHGHWRPSSA